MRIEQLQYVAAVTQHGSLRRASERLHLSQPALSEAVTKLEKELGVDLLDRLRSGARISRTGRELLPHLVEVLEAVDRLRLAAGDQNAGARTVRVGTVNAATSTLLVPAMRSLHRRWPDTTVEVLTLQQDEIDEGLTDGSIDLGLVNVLGGDDPPVDLIGDDLLHGRPVVVLPEGHPLAAETTVSVEMLRAERFVMMRSGYLMHRFVHRIFGRRLPAVCHSTDGAEMGKALVADGLGVTVLPDYSVIGDPLHRAGVIVVRPIRDESATVTLVLRRRRGGRVPASVRAMHAALVARAGEFTAGATATAEG